VYTFADGLEEVDVECCRASVVTVVHEQVEILDAAGPFHRVDSMRGLSCEHRYNRLGVPVQDDVVHVNIVGVEDLREVERLEDGGREVGGERVFVGTVNHVSTNE
jgi:hypothetical protein